MELQWITTINEIGNYFHLYELFQMFQFNVYLRFIFFTISLFIDINSRFPSLAPVYRKKGTRTKEGGGCYSTTSIP